MITKHHDTQNKYKMNLKQIIYTNINKDIKYKHYNDTSVLPAAVTKGSLGVCLSQSVPNTEYYNQINKQLNLNKYIYFPVSPIET